MGRAATLTILSLRYQTIPAERQRISSEIVQAILKAFKGHYPAVKFGYPHSVVRYQADEPPALGSARPERAAPSDGAMT